jgi:hypothetical protein
VNEPAIMFARIAGKLATHRRCRTKRRSKSERQARRERREACGRGERHCGRRALSAGPLTEKRFWVNGVHSGRAQYGLGFRPSPGGLILDYFTAEK